MQATDTILANEALPDFLIRKFGSISGMFDLALLNDLGVTSSPAGGTILLIPSELKKVNTRISGPLPVSPLAVKKVQVMPMQALADIAIQEGGSMEVLFDLALKNDLGITAEANGEQVELPETRDPRMVNTLSAAGIKPASMDQGTRNRGIGYMQIGTSFKVS